MISNALQLDTQESVPVLQLGPPVTIPVRLVKVSNQYSVEIQDPAQKYLSVHEDTSVILTWNLVLDGLDAGLDACFDTPAVTFFGEATGATDVSVPSPHSQTYSMTWNNEASTRGRSFYYRLHVLVKEANGTVIAVNHDPTVHNDPPTI